MDHSDTILWRMMSGRNDWRGGEPLRRLINAASRLGLIGPPSRIESGRPAALKPKLTKRVLGVEPGDSLASALIEVGSSQGKIGGDTPTPWEIFWNVDPFDDEEGVDGHNTVWFTFHKSRIPDRDASDALREAFIATCAEDIECATLHPYDAWLRLSHGPYDVPVTNSLQFRGVFWLTFLGRTLIPEFDVGRLQNLLAHELRWVGSDRLFIVALPELASTDAPEAEATLVQLTERLRSALRADSRWA